MSPAKFERDRHAPTLGLYVHFPWCLQKCPYCDFLSVKAPRQSIPHRKYADAVIAEIEQRHTDLGERRLESVFFGGGTPSLWEPEEFARVLETIRRLWPDDVQEIEITAECNPSSLDVARAQALLALGINRLSIGVQALDDARLRFLGRLHDAEGGCRAVRDAIAASTPRVSADMIFGVAGQSPQESADEVGRVADLGVQHLSAYALTIEPNTRFGALARRGKLPLLGEEGQAEAFVAVEQALETRGFEHYEISNYALPGQRSQHNVGYWLGRDYLGVGCGAWGTVKRRADGHGASELSAVRYRNSLSPERYLALDVAEANLWQATAMFADHETLSAETLLTERIMLGLRLREGVNLAQAAEELGVEVWTAERRRSAERLQARGQLQQVGDHWLIPKGQWLFADAIARELM